jgi:hypothetical protein
MIHDMFMKEIIVMIILTIHYLVTFIEIFFGGEGG